jgi:hypothetical protein
MAERSVDNPTSPLDNVASQMGEHALREKAREVIQTAKLPNRCPDQMWGGPGVGANCAICGAPVNHDELELEIELAREDEGPSLSQYHFHIQCFAAWEAECRSGQVETLPRAAEP